MFWKKYSTLTLKGIANSLPNTTCVYIPCLEKYSANKSTTKQSYEKHNMTWEETTTSVAET